MNLIIAVLTAVTLAVPSLVLAEQEEWTYDTCPVFINTKGTELLINQEHVLFLDEETGEVVDNETKERFSAPSIDDAYVPNSDSIPSWLLDLIDKKLHEHRMPLLRNPRLYKYLCVVGAA